MLVAEILGGGSLGGGSGGRALAKSTTVLAGRCLGAGILLVRRERRVVELCGSLEERAESRLLLMGRRLYEAGVGLGI